MPTCCCHLTLDLSNKYRYQLMGVSIGTHTLVPLTVHTKRLSMRTSPYYHYVFHTGRIVHMHVLKAYGEVAM